MINLKIEPHVFKNWEDAYTYSRAAGNALIAQVAGTIAIICPLGSYQDLEDIQGCFWRKDMITKTDVALLAADLSTAVNVTQERKNLQDLARRAADMLFRLADQLPEDCSAGIEPPARYDHPQDISQEEQS